VGREMGVKGHVLNVVRMEEAFRVAIFAKDLGCRIDHLKDIDGWRGEVRECRWISYSIRVGKDIIICDIIWVHRATGEIINRLMVHIASPIRISDIISKHIIS
jgi:hypothetical protein